MTDHKQYLGDLIGGSLMIKDSQLIADLLLKDPSTKQWHDAIVEQNILQKQSVASAITIISQITHESHESDEWFTKEEILINNYISSQTAKKSSAEASRRKRSAIKHIGRSQATS